MRCMCGEAGGFLLLCEIHIELSLHTSTNKRPTNVHNTWDGKNKRRKKSKTEKNEWFQKRKQKWKKRDKENIRQSKSHTINWITFQRQFTVKPNDKDDNNVADHSLCAQESCNWDKNNPKIYLFKITYPSCSIMTFNKVFRL